MGVINQDHPVVSVEHESGEFTLKQEEVGTRYVFVILRTFVDANNPKDIELANDLQDQVQVIQSNAGVFEIPNWEQESLIKIRETINILAADVSDASELFDYSI